MESINCLLEEAKWDAEFGENRLYEHEHDAATVLIHRAYAMDLLCHFDSLDEGFEFAHAFLREHTSDIRSELKGSKTYIEWRDNKGALWGADYTAGHNLEAIKSGVNNHVGSGRCLQLFLDKGVSNDTDACIVPAGLAMKLGSYNDPSSAHAVSKYIKDHDKNWRQEIVLGKMLMGSRGQ